MLRALVTKMPGATRSQFESSTAVVGTSSRYGLGTRHRSAPPADAASMTKTPSTTVALARVHPRALIVATVLRLSRITASTSRACRWGARCSGAAAYPRRTCTRHAGLPRPLQRVAPDPGVIRTGQQVRAIHDERTNRVRRLRRVLHPCATAVSGTEDPGKGCCGEQGRAA